MPDFIQTSQRSPFNRFLQFTGTDHSLTHSLTAALDQSAAGGVPVWASIDS